MKIESRIEVTGRRQRRRKQLLDDLKETRGYLLYIARGSTSSHCFGDLALEEAVDLS
jgi:hypothetical protein